MRKITTINIDVAQIVAEQSRVASSVGFYALN